MRLIYTGAEVGSNRTLLEGMGVRTFGWSYMRARKRGFPKSKVFSFKDYFPEGSVIVVHPGISEIQPGEVEEIAADYQDFIVTTLDEITAFVEFQHPSLDPKWTESQRGFWEQADEKFWPIWDGSNPAELHALAQRFTEVALSGDVIDKDTSLAGRTRALSSQYGTVWHGLAVASPDNLRQVPLTTASTGAWQSPMRRGETIVWDGMSLKRYPKKMKDQARPRYKRAIEQAGLDYNAIVTDDAKEVTRLAIWSYQRLEENMDKKKPSSNPFHVIDGGGESEEVDNSESMLMSTFAEEALFGVDNTEVATRKPERTVPAPRAASERAFLPSMGVQTQTVVDTGEDGRDVLKEVPVMTSTGVSLRQCDTCFVAANCPAFKPASECGFSLPVEIRTREQLKSLLQAIIEMQASRVAFAKFAEDLNGGYPDPNTSQEMDRLFKLVTQLKEMEANKEKLSITMERQGSAGVLSSIFGDRAQALQELDQGPLSESQTTQIISQSLET